MRCNPSASVSRTILSHHAPRIGNPIPLASNLFPLFQFFNRVQRFFYVGVAVLKSCAFMRLRYRFKDLAGPRLRHRGCRPAPPCPLQIFFFMDVPCTAGGHVVATQILFQGNWTRQILDARSKFPKAAQTTAFLRRRTSSGFRSRRHRGGARRGFAGNTLHHGPSTAALGHVIREGRREDHALWELYGTHVAILDNQCPILRLSRRTRHLSRSRPCGCCKPRSCGRQLRANKLLWY